MLRKHTLPYVSPGFPCLHQLIAFSLRGNTIQIPILTRTRATSLLKSRKPMMSASPFFLHFVRSILYRRSRMRRNGLRLTNMVPLHNNLASSRTRFRKLSVVVVPVSITSPQRLGLAAHRDLVSLNHCSVHSTMTLPLVGLVPCAVKTLRLASISPSWNRARVPSAKSRFHPS